MGRESVASSQAGQLKAVGRPPQDYVRILFAPSTELKTSSPTSPFGPPPLRDFYKPTKNGLSFGTCPTCPARRVVKSEGKGGYYTLVLDK